HGPDPATWSRRVLPGTRTGSLPSVWAIPGQRAGARRETAPGDGFMASILDSQRSLCVDADCRADVGAGVVEVVGNGGICGRDLLVRGGYFRGYRTPGDRRRPVGARPGLRSTGSRPGGRSHMSPDSL